MTPATAPPASLGITTAWARMPASCSSGQAAGEMITGTARRRRVWRPAPRLARGRGRSPPLPSSPGPMRCVPWRPSLETVQPRAPDTTSVQRRGPVLPSHTRDARLSIVGNIQINNPRLVFQGNKNNFHTEEDCQQFCSEVSEGESTTTSTTTAITTASSTESSTATTSLMTSEVNISLVTATLNMKSNNYSECSLPPEKGTCSESLTRFHYVPELEKCIPFLFSGCKVQVKKLLLFRRYFYLVELRFFLQGNSNNFDSRKECFAACHPQEEDFQLSGSGDGDSDEDASEDDLNKLNLPIWLPFPVAHDSSPDSVCVLVQVSSSNISIVHISCSSDPLQDPGPCHPLDPAKYLRRYYFNISSSTCQM